MNTFIFDKYGYFVDDDYASEFELSNWFFKLEATQKSEMELNELNYFIIDVDNSLFKQGVRIVNTRNNELSSLSEFGQLSLVAVKKFNVSITDVFLMHQRYMYVSQKENVNYISSIKEVWINKTNFIEEKVLPSFKIDNYVYDKIYVTLIYTLGLAENAISYLQDITLDYGDKIERLTIAHKRLDTLNSYNLLNPFNLIIDSPIRDISDLYQIDIVNIDNIESILNNYMLDKKEASLLLARILFPSSLFDILQEHYILKKDVKKEILIYLNKLEEKINKITLIHNYLVNRYGIRPINWLLLRCGDKEYEKDFKNININRNTTFNSRM